MTKTPPSDRGDSNEQPEPLVAAISASGFTIYDVLTERTDLFLDEPTLERLLRNGLIGQTFDQSPRARSKCFKAAICRALGYPVPSSFKKTKPRFPGQNFDTYAQQSTNLQVWNDEIPDLRRYVVAHLDARGTVDAVRVITGSQLAALDKTGTLTSKYQARPAATVRCSQLVCPTDTERFRGWLSEGAPTSSAFRARVNKIDPRTVMGIAELHARLSGLEGATLDNPGATRDRSRGDALHRLVSDTLDVGWFANRGIFPDIAEQVLEVKLQTRDTIDLGLTLPDDIVSLYEFGGLRPCDVRFAVFFATGHGPKVRIDHVVVTTGASFFTFFRRCEGKVKNSKLQIPLPSDFFRDAK